MLWHALRLGFPNKGDIITITQKCMDTVRRKTIKNQTNKKYMVQIVN